MKCRLFVLSLAATVFALSAMASACGGGGDELKQALDSLGANDLAIMVLPQEELGDEFADLEVDEDSGFEDNKVRADDTIDPDDTADDLERAGRINGYDLTYSDPALSALDAGEGVIAVSTEVELFEDASAASDFLAKQMDDFGRLEGEEIESGLTLAEVDTFAVDGLADEAMGLRSRGAFGDTEFYDTTVAFRLDRLVGAAVLDRADDADVNSQVEEIARKLEGRIEGALLGEVTGTPVPVPPGGDEETTVPRPEGAPDLAAMALSLDDLPAGVSVDREGYVEDEDTVASYEREFDVSLVRIGTSRFTSLENDIGLYADASEALAPMFGFEALLTGESGPDLFAAGFSEGAGLDVTNVQMESLPLPDLGDDSFGLHVSFDTPIGPLEVVYAVARVGRASGLLILTGSAGEVDVTDVIPLAEAMAQRMTTQ